MSTEAIAEKVKHTPGPWSIQQVINTQHGCTATIHVGEGKTYGNPLCKVLMGGPGALHSNEESVMANSKLIACAPDMYDIIKELYDWSIRHNTQGPIFPKLEAVMNKINS